MDLWRVCEGLSIDDEYYWELFSGLDLSSRIIGGHDVQNGEYSHMVIIDLVCKIIIFMY